MTINNQILNNALFRQIVETANEGIFVSDRDAKAVFVNPMMANLLRLTEDEIIGRSITDFIIPEDIEKFKHDLELFCKESVLRTTIRFKETGGSYFWGLVSTSPILDPSDNCIGSLSMITDISDQKLKSTLLSNISLELRSPMNAIMGFAELLDEVVQEPDQRKMTRTILSSGKRLMTTLNAIMDLVDIDGDKSKLNFNTYDIGELTDHLIKRYELDALKKGIKLIIHSQVGCYAQLDRPFFERILECLIDNAIKFTHKGFVSITTSKGTYNNSKTVFVKIQDTGIGIAPENHNVIFDEFRQISVGFGREYEGTGIGLSLSKKMAALMKGIITVDSQLGAGSTFCLHLPQVDAPRLPGPSTLDMELMKLMNERLPANSIKPLILVVEDNHFNLELLEIFLNPYYQVDKATDGLSAIRFASTKQYKAILMDINLGIGMDGLRATKEIRKIPGYEIIPIVAVTGYTTREEKVKLKEGGLNYYLAKPFEKKTLLELLLNILDPKNPA